MEGHSVEDVNDSPNTPEVPPRSEGPTPCIITSSMRKKRQITAVGDSLLSRTGGLILRADPPHREGCFLSGSWVMDITRKLPSLVQPSDYSLLLIAHVGKEEAASHSPRMNKGDYRALGLFLRASGTQVIISFFFSVTVSDTGRNRWFRFY